EEQFGQAEVGDQHFEIFEGDARRVVAERGGLIVPRARVEEVFGIGMKSQVPIEIAFSLCALIEVVDELATGEGLPLVAAGIANVPVMFQREINASGCRIMATVVVHESTRAVVY